MNGAARLREQLASERMIVAPGVFDGLQARLAEQAGFETLYMTGAGAAAARGYPDYGLITLTEMAETAGIIAHATRVPLIADADTGFGNELNVTRTMREYEMRGVAAIQIEDQVSPKRCGHLDGKEIVPRSDFISKIRSASAARSAGGMLLIARTDACGVAGLDEAIWRANAAIEAGADIAFVEAPRNREEVAAVPREVRGPCLFILASGGKTPVFSLDEIEAFGYRIAIAPGLLINAVVHACDEALHTLAKTRALPDADDTLTLKRFFQRMGADEWDAIRSGQASVAINS
ncbi:2-methylisocitrate lyase-like PEP mutase family enzyme [Paraburkholderia sp. BL6669N2]|uniref:isocitrate lyase/PEP mutase family protein n=1 Tax=Paraburkholderia sp. BL6669N2 TaxID=1938807 RepID=UPI000E223612|nr:isocitrate lyase/PEP mutase family protein [Paraburkholderia sp. BL6669N2]REG50967.1 2-methylisocitrate lyase-like PEP mutase family enzyme [Paraburkholderia sp. BL6669N2]